MSSQDPASVSEEPDCNCKIGRNMEKYGLEDLDGRLLDRRADGASLRKLEGAVNRALLRRALTDADGIVIGDVSGIYEKLTDDDTSAGERTETRERLDRAGIDVEALCGDFVSYQTVRTHLRECLDVDTDRREDLTVPDAKQTIEWTRSRSKGIVTRTIERLERSDEITTGDVDVSHVIRVSCPDCQSTYPVETFVERGGCQCDAPGTSGT